MSQDGDVFAVVERCMSSYSPSKAHALKKLIENEKILKETLDFVEAQIQSLMDEKKSLLSKIFENHASIVLEISQSTSSCASVTSGSSVLSTNLSNNKVDVTISPSSIEPLSLISSIGFRFPPPETVKCSNYHNCEFYCPAELDFWEMWECSGVGCLNKSMAPVIRGWHCADCKWSICVNCARKRAGREETYGPLGSDGYCPKDIIPERFCSWDDPSNLANKNSSSTSNLVGSTNPDHSFYDSELSVGSLVMLSQNPRSKEKDPVYGSLAAKRVLYVTGLKTTSATIENFSGDSVSLAIGCLRKCGRNSLILNRAGVPMFWGLHPENGVYVPYCGCGVCKPQSLCSNCVSLTPY